MKGKNGTVIVFLSAQCPVVKGYNERIRQIAADYAAKGITFIGVNSNASESLEWVRSNAQENYKFPVLIDKGNVLADKLGANVRLRRSISMPKMCCVITERSTTTGRERR